MLHNFWMDLPHRCLSHGWLCLACPQLRRELQAFTCLVNFSDTSLGMSGAGPSEVTVSFHLCWVPSQLLFRKVFNSVFTATRTDRYCCLALEVRERRLGSDANCSESGTAECQGSNVGLMLHPLRCGGPFPSLRSSVVAPRMAVDEGARTQWQGCPGSWDSALVPFLIAERLGWK